MQYYYNYEALEDFTNIGDILDGIFLQFFALLLCTIGGIGKQGCYNTAWARIQMNGGNPEIEKNGAYAVLDLWTWRGWTLAFAFWIVHELFAELLFANVIAIGFAFVYMMSSDLPLCVEGDIVYNVPFSKDKIDLCTALGLDTSTIDLRYIKYA